MSSGVRLLQTLARVPDHPKVHQWEAQHCQHRDLWVGDETDEALFGRSVGLLHDRKRAFQRFSSRLWSALVHIRLSTRCACSERKKRVTCITGESVRSICRCKGLPVLSAQIEQETEPVQQQTTHAVLWNIGQQ